MVAKPRSYLLCVIPLFNASNKTSWSGWSACLQSLTDARSGVLTLRHLKTLVLNVEFNELFKSVNDLPAPEPGAEISQSPDMFEASEELPRRPKPFPSIEECEVSVQ